MAERQSENVENQNGQNESNSDEPHNPQPEELEEGGNGLEVDDDSQDTPPESNDDPPPPKKTRTTRSQIQWEKRQLGHILKVAANLKQESRWPPNIAIMYLGKDKQVCFEAPDHLESFCRSSSEAFRDAVTNQPFRLQHQQCPSTGSHQTTATATTTTCTTTTCTTTSYTTTSCTSTSAPTSTSSAEVIALPFPSADMYHGTDLAYIIPKILERCEGLNQHKRYRPENRPSWWPRAIPFNSPTFSKKDHKKVNADQRRSTLASFMLLRPDSFTVCGDSVITPTTTTEPAPTTSHLLTQATSTAPTTTTHVLTITAPTPYTTTVTTPVTCTTTTTTRSTHSISTASSTRKRHMTPATHILTHTPNTTTPTTCTTTTLASSTVSTSVVTPPDTTSTTVCTTSTSSTATMMWTSAPPSRQSIQPLIRYIQSMDELRCDGGHLLARVDGVSVYTPDLQSCLTNSLTPQVMDAYTLALLPTIPPLTQARTQYLPTGSCAHYLYPSIYPPPTTPVAFTHPNICGFFHVDQSCWLFMYASMERKLVTVVTPHKSKNEGCLRVLPAFTKMLKAQGMSDQWDVAAIEGYHKFSHPSTGTLCLIYAEKYLRGQNCGENITSPLHALQHHILTTIVLSSDDLRWRCRMCCGEIEQDSTQHSNCCICRGFRNHYVCLNHHSTGKRAKWVCPICSYF